MVCFFVECPHPILFNPGTVGYLPDFFSYLLVRTFGGN